MAKRDVLNFYKEQQKVYFEMVEDIKEVDKAFREGNLEESVANQLREQLEVIKSNYERISYIFYLLNLPLKDKNKKDYIENNVDLEAFFKKEKADQAAVYRESKKALDDLKKLIKENLI